MFTERKMQDDFRKTTLFDLTSQTILSNKALYCHLAERTSDNPFCHIGIFKKK